MHQVFEQQEETSMYISVHEPLTDLTYLQCKIRPIYQSGSHRSGSGTCVLTKGPAGKSSDTELLADSGAGQMGRLVSWIGGGGLAMRQLRKRYGNVSSVIKDWSC